jgi:Uma2 family endonuclease
MAFLPCLLIAIGVNIVSALRADARQQGCFMYSSDMKLRIEDVNTFYYPDVMVVCAPANLDPQAMYETAPCLLIEVTSRSTAQNDRLAKYAAYMALPSLQTYLIVEQAERRVYAYQREGKAWRLEELASSGSVNLPALGRSLTLDEIHADVPV